MLDGKGRLLRDTGQGFPHLDGHGRGDQYILVKVVTPQNLTEQEKQLLSEFDVYSGKRAREQDIFLDGDDYGTFSIG